MLAAYIKVENYQIIDFNFQLKKEQFKPKLKKSNLKSSKDKNRK